MSGPILEWGVATRTLRGEADSGDRHLVQVFPGGALVAVVDGLGHGEEAAEAAELAVTTLQRHPRESPIALMKRCHDQLLGTRGVVMSLAVFDASASTMIWLGVGNVDGMLLARSADRGVRREALVLRGGVVGGSLPPLRASVVPVVRGDTLIFTTDGVSDSFGTGLALGDAPKALADRILARHAKGTDDALVLVARYAGWQP